MNNQEVNKGSGRRGKERNPAEFAVLGVLARGPAHGYEVHQHLSDNLGAVWRLKTSQVYALLEKLETEDLVSHRRVEQAARPAKKVFALTPAGQTAFQAWLDSPVAKVRQLRLEFLAKLHFARLGGPAAEAALIKAQKAVCAEEAARLSQELEEASNFIDQRAGRLRLAMAQAAIDWLEGSLR